MLPQHMFDTAIVRVDDATRSVIASGETTFAASVEGHISQWQDVRVEARVQIEFLLGRFLQFALQLSNGFSYDAMNGMWDISAPA